MVDDEKHKTLSKWSKKDYMRDYMRERRKKARQPPRPDLHGPPAPPNLPRTDSPKAILKAHLNHVLNLWAETGKELARLKDADEMLQVIDSLTLEVKTLQAENKTLQAEVKNLREASKPCQSELKAPEPPQEPPKTCDLQPSEHLEPQEPQGLQPSEPPKPPKPPEPGFVDPDRRPSGADDTEWAW